MTTNAPMLGFLARRQVSAQWRGFVRSLVETLDVNLEKDDRDALLRAIGARLAAQMPLPATTSLGALEQRMNDALAESDWGFVEISFDLERDRLVLSHAAAPAIATESDAAGGWIAPVLEGLYSAWFAAQEGAVPELTATVVEVTVGRLQLDYGLA